jgi:branched-chain amino acid transport system substrate-binding protein
MTTRRSAIALGALIAAGLAAPALAQQKPIRVGVLQPLSGAQATYGRETQPVIEQMFKKINAAGGIKSMGGAKLEMVIADTASQSAQAAREAIRLTTQENVDIVIGALLTNDMLAASRAIDDSKTPTISFFAGGTQTPYAYSVGFPYDDGYAASMADFVEHLKTKTKIPVQRVVLAYANYEGGQQINKFLKQRIEKLGLTVAAEVALDMKAQDYTAALIKIRNEKPDIVVGLMLQNQINGLQQARYQLKYYDSIFLSTLAHSDMRLKRELGEAVAKEVLPKGIFGMALYSPSAKLESVQKLADEMINEAKMGDAFGQLSIPAAQGVRVLQAALELAASTDKEKLREAIGKVQLKPGDAGLYFPLLRGLSFGEDRMVKNLRSMIVQWSASDNPEPLVVFPEGVAAAQPRK